MSEELTVEATGETVGEAKWKALRELELRAPGLDKATVRFQVLSEGERGLLGVGYTPARVLAAAAAPDGPAPAGASVTGAAPEDETPLEQHVRAFVGRVVAALGVRCTIDVREDDDTVTATCHGGDLGLLIGRHGQTIDALQFLANAALARDDGERKHVVIDAAGYRDRRHEVLVGVATRAADQALATGAAVELDPMTSVERRVVHEQLKDHGGVATASEGNEPHRYVVVRPA